MKPVLVQALQVTAIGLLLGIALGYVRGFPVPPPPATSCGGPVPTHPQIQWITQEQARADVDDPTVLFVDARPLEVYEAGHVLNALDAPIETGTLPPGLVDALRGARRVITYCDTEGECAQSSRLAGLLSMQGLPDVRVLEGGMPRWLENGYPAEAGPCRNCP